MALDCLRRRVCGSPMAVAINCVTKFGSGRTLGNIGDRGPSVKLADNGTTEVLRETVHVFSAASGSGTTTSPALFPAGTSCDVIMVNPGFVCSVLRHLFGLKADIARTVPDVSAT